MLKGMGWTCCSERKEAFCQIRFFGLPVVQPFVLFTGLVFSNDVFLSTEHWYQGGFYGGRSFLYLYVSQERLPNLLNYHIRSPGLFVCMIALATDESALHSQKKVCTAVNIALRRDTRYCTSFSRPSSTVAL